MIFNSPEFHALNGVEPTTYGCLTGVWKDGVFENGYSAPFAGFDIPDDTPPWRVQEMVEKAVCALDMSRIEQVVPIRIKLPPPIYTHTWHAQVKALLDLGFRVERSEINQHVDCRRGFVEFPKSTIKKMTAFGWYEFIECETNAECRRAYDILVENRSAKGRPLKLSFDYLMKMRETASVVFYSMNDCAAAVVYRLAEDYVLVVYWGHVVISDTPMPTFASCLFREHPHDILDLGISTDPGLMQFKRSVGAKEGLRLDMVRGL